MRDQILSTYAMTLDTAKRLVEGVPDERFAELPFIGAMHPAWVLGHLCVAGGMGAAFLAEDGGVSDPLAGVDAAWAEAVAPGTTPVTNRSVYPAKDRLLSELERVHSLYAQRLGTASDALLESPLPKVEYRDFFPKQIDCVVYMMVHHEGYHLGQLSSWRRAAGFGPVGQ